MKISLEELELVTNQSGLTTQDILEIEKMLSIAAQKKLVSPRSYDWLTNKFHKETIIALKYKKIVASVVLTEITKSAAILEAAVWRGGYEIGFLLREHSISLAKKIYSHIYCIIFKDNTTSLKVWLSNDFELIDESKVDKVVLLALQPTEKGKEYFVLHCSSKQFI